MKPSIFIPPGPRASLRSYLLTALALVGCGHPSPDTSVDSAAESTVERNADLPDSLVPGVRPGMSNPWASDTQYPTAILETPLSEAQRELLGEYNWRTGKPFAERELARLAYLHQQLPGNSTLLPFDPDARAQQAAEHEANRELAYIIDRGDATAEQLQSYYAFKERHYIDRLELIDFILSEGFWDQPTRLRYERSRETAERELAKTRANLQSSLYQRE